MESVWKILVERLYNFNFPYSMNNLQISTENNLIFV